MDRVEARPFLALRRPFLQRRTDAIVLRRTGTSPLTSRLLPDVRPSLGLW
jgi:hypothetical protein